jgi:4-amino-4-deoxy-L-arabinose transferase-like glycosyltransferase
MSLTSVLLAGIVVLAVTIRAVSYATAPSPVEGAGLAAEQGEMARNTLDHGKWFVVNEDAIHFVNQRQAAESKLIDPEAIDYSRFENRPKYAPEINQMPGVSLVLLGLWWVTGAKTFQSIQWLQILLDAAMVLLVYWIAHRLTSSRRVGIIASFLYAVSPIAVVAKRPVPDTWAIFFAVACVAVFLWAMERPIRWSRLVLLGLLTGVGIYFRPFILLMPLALALVAFPMGDWRPRLAAIAVPSCVALLVLAPWTIRNYVEFHRFIPTRTGLGYAIYEGLGKSATDQAATDYARAHRPDLKPRDPGIDQYLLRSAFRAIKDDPRGYAEAILRRARWLLPCLLLFAIWRRWRRAGVLLVMAAAATIVPYLLIGDEARFYIPALFAYFILVGMAVESAFLLVRGRVMNRSSSRPGAPTA